MSYVVCDILASYCNGNWINLYIQNLILAACILAAAWRTNPSCLFSKWSKHSPSQDTGSVRVWRPHHRDVASAILHHLWPLQGRAALLWAQHGGSWMTKKKKKKGLWNQFSFYAKKTCKGGLGRNKELKFLLRPLAGSSSSARPQKWEDAVAQGSSSSAGPQEEYQIPIPDLKKNTISDGISRRIQRVMISDDALKKLITKQYE